MCVCVCIPVCVQRASLPLQNRADAVLTFRQKHKLGLLKSNSESEARRELTGSDMTAPAAAENKTEGKKNHKLYLPHHDTSFSHQLVLKATEAQT